MKTHNLLQGTKEWHAYRIEHLNASDAPAAMGQSSYKTRNQLIKERATEIIPEVDPATQRRFDDGHRFEALARPLAESIIGSDLYPVTGSLGKYSASFDGLTMEEDIGFEHKSLNNTLRSTMVDGCTGADLPMEYQIQMEQQCLVAGCDKVLFMASKWDGDTLIEERHCWYEKNLVLRGQIIDAWEQLEADVAAYVPVAPVTKTEVDVQSQLPVVVINVTGQLSASNLDQVTPKFDTYLANTKTTLVTDQDFADGESNAKFSRTTAKALKTKAKEVIEQIASISDAVRTLELYAGKFDALGLKLEKSVKEQKELIKTNLIHEAHDKLREHVSKLNERIGKPYMPVINGNWSDVVKNKRTIESLHNAIDTELARTKIEASALADRIELNLKTTGLADYQFLFADLSTLCLKDSEDFAAVVAARIQDHKTKEAVRLEAETNVAKQPEQEIPGVQQNATPVATPVRLASDILVGSMNTERQRINTMLDNLNANQITAVLNFVADLYRKAA